MSSDCAIRVDNLSKCYAIYDNPRDRLVQMLLFGRRKFYREFWALRDISFEVKKGETVGIIGRNGSGKSTLLQLICGTLAQTSGTIHTCGRVAALLELGSGFNPEFTGLENVYLNAKVLGLSDAEINDRMAAIKTFADIGEFINQPVKTYSSGMYVRLAFAVAINVDPDILVVDEALAVGDIRFQLKCQRKMDELRDRGTTILLVSHSGSDVLRLCSRAIWLDEGKVRSAGTSKHVVEEYSAWMLHDTGVSVSSIHQDHSQLDADHSLIPVPPHAFITGDGGAEVQAVGLFSREGKRLVIISQPEFVTLLFRIAVKKPINQPYFGFQIVDSKGLRVMGCNTPALESRFDPIPAGREVVVRFRFNLPEIENGSYVIAVGVADGSPECHIRHQFVADAYEFKVSSTSSFQKQSVLLKLPDCVVDLMGV